MPKNVRPDDKERTGIQVLVWEPGTRNLVLVSVKEPSEAAKFFAVEKAVRAELNYDYTSQNSADPTNMKFAGSVSLGVDQIVGFEDYNNCLIASTSGLKAEEDVAVSVAILAKITGLSLKDVCKNIDLNEGALPEWFYNENKKYFQFLFE